MRDGRWFVSLLMCSILCTSCNETNSTTVDQQSSTMHTYTSTISGIVVRDDNSQPISNATIFDRGGFALSSTTDSNGSYIMRFQLPSAYSTSLITTCQGYLNDTSKVLIDPGENKTFNIRLKK